MRPCADFVASLGCALFRIDVRKTFFSRGGLVGEGASGSTGLEMRVVRAGTLNVERPSSRREVRAEPGARGVLVPCVGGRYLTLVGFFVIVWLEAS